MYYAVVPIHRRSQTREVRGMRSVLKRNQIISNERIVEFKFVEVALAPPIILVKSLARTVPALRLAVMDQSGSFFRLPAYVKKSQPIHQINSCSSTTTRSSSVPLSISSSYP